MSWTWLRRPAFLVAAASGLAVASALLAVPQFGLLNYYFALAMGFPLTIAAGVLGARLAGDHPRFIRVGALPIAAAGALLWALPLVVVSLGSIWIRNCAPGLGLVHWIVGPGVGVALALATGAWLGRGLGPGRGAAAFLLLWLGLAGWNFLHFWRHPPIAAYNPFVGYVSGAVYDDLVRIHERWAAFRLTGALQAVALWVAWWLHRSGRTRVVMALLVLTALSVGIADRVFQRTTEDIADALGGRLETEHFVLHYPTGGELEARIDRLARDHEFRYAQLETLLGVAPEGRVHSFLYETEAQKRELMGAGRTYIARPWSRQIHLNAIEEGAFVLKHELAHVFGGRIHTGWLGVPTRYGILPRMALVEGFAVALTWANGRLTPHQWSAALLELDIAPPLERILEPSGFLGTHSGQAYALAGSLIRWLMDTRGSDRLRALYASGDLKGTYGETPADLVAGWRAFLMDRSAVPLTDADLARTRALFDAPSRFHRVCALSIASWEREAADAAADGDEETALRLRELVLSFEPEDRGKQLRVAGALRRAGRAEESLDMLRRIAADPEAGAVLRATATLGIADSTWRLGRLEEARDAYRLASTGPFDRATRRRIRISLRALAWPDTERDAARAYLLDEAPPDALAPALEADRAEAWYLSGKRAFADDGLEAANESLKHALTAGLDDPLLEREAWHVLGILALRADRRDAAIDAFTRARDLSSQRGWALVEQDWIDRSRFF